MITLSFEFFGGFHTFFYGKIKNIRKKKEKKNGNFDFLIFLDFWIFSFKSRHFKRKSPGKIKELKKKCI
jgi:hypothetical protein